MATKLSVLIVLFMFFAVVVNGASPPKVFNVVQYGAVGNDKVNNTQAFLRAWNDACAYLGTSTVQIPQGEFPVGSVTFLGPCNGSMVFQIDGNLIAPTDPKYFTLTDTWIQFQYLENLTVKGGGSLDGQGNSAWNYCADHNGCKFQLPTSLRLSFVNDSRIYNITSLNSKNTHIHVFACNNLDFRSISLIAPAESPNTDGIKIGSSKSISVSRSTIKTGDDCVAILAGTKNMSVTEVVCGPGHGISIGSIGRGGLNDHVEGISVTNCTFIGSDNGVRIKTWAPSDYNLVSNINYQDLRMEGVANPIIIDQQYCPSSNCNATDSGVQVENVTYKNIWGISRTKLALELKCSRSKPCKNIKLSDINLTYNGSDGPAESKCSNVVGSSNGKQIPGGCL